MNLTATEPEIPLVHAWVEQVATEIGLEPSAVFALQLCLEEAISNIVHHCADAAGLPVKLHLHADPGHLSLQVEDHGRPFDPTSVPEPAMPQSLEAAEIGGLGIHLIRHFSSAQTYERVNGLNRLTLSFDA